MNPDVGVEPSTGGLPAFVAIARGLPTNELLPAVDALLDAGVRAVEVTLDSPDAYDSIRQLSRTHGPATLIGAGTVRSLDQASAAADAGAAFLLSPNTDEAIVARTRALGLLSVPGAFTPTEIERAWRAGANYVKVFPLHQLGAGYLRAIREPLSDVALLACGGLDAPAAAECLRAGAQVVGIGLGLLDAAAVAARDWTALRRSTTAFLRAIDDAAPARTQRSA